MKAKKTKKEKEPFWNELVEVYFNFCIDKFGDKPSFDGSAPRDLKNIIISLHTRAIEKQIEWTDEVATKRFFKFLEFAYMDNWLSQNFMLFNINRQKDKIFFNISKLNLKQNQLQ
jgi:hypothetical protein